MDSYKEKDYKVFEMFDKQWAVVTAGEPDNFNSCTVSWGSSALPGAATESAARR